MNIKLLFFIFTLFLHYFHIQSCDATLRAYSKTYLKEKNQDKILANFFDITAQKILEILDIEKNTINISLFKNDLEKAFTVASKDVKKLIKRQENIHKSLQCMKKMTKKVKNSFEEEYKLTCNILEAIALYSTQEFNQFLSNKNSTDRLLILMKSFFFYQAGACGCCFGLDESLEKFISSTLRHWIFEMKIKSDLRKIIKEKVIKYYSNSN